MKIFTFNSSLFLGSDLKDYPENAIKNEPMFFGCDLTFVSDYTGPCGLEFINHLPKNWLEDKSLIIDSRVHMLMPGWFPCIPGWHHDDVPRERSDGQSNYDNPSYKASHCLALFNGDIAPTEFAVGEIELPDVALGEKYYKVWHPIIEQKIKENKLERVQCPSNKMVYFNHDDLHQGTRAVKSGWRYFIRASINTKRKINNEIRRQVQVYLDNPMEGW